MEDENRDELHENFAHFDRDGNGVIDRVEFCKLLAVLDPEITQAEADIGFEAIDTDGNGSIAFDEFEAWWNEMRTCC